MISPTRPKNEKQRQAAVNKYKILDTLPEESFDNITSLMTFICKTPISLITLLDKDRNFLKSHCGVPFNESPRELSFCGHAINSDDDIMVVRDARQDERFHDNPLVTDFKAIFYAGVPLIDPQGYKLGTLCVYDHEPRDLSVEQIAALKAMAQQVVLLFEQRYQNMQLKQLQRSLKSRYKELRQFAGIVSHDLKSPLANIESLTELIEASAKDQLDDESLELFELLKQSSFSLRQYIDGLLIYYKSDVLSKEQKDDVLFSHVVESVRGIVRVNPNVELFMPKNDIRLHINKGALLQVLMNLITNAIKYNDKEAIKITLGITEDAEYYHFSIKDNGLGILPKDQDKIFELFAVTGDRDKGGMLGSGIGLATVKKIVELQGGSISVDSERGIGSTFHFSMAKL